MPRHRNAGGPFLIFEPGIGITGSLGVAGKIAITSESSTPAQPPDGSGWLYTKSDGKLYWRSYDITEVDITGGGGGGGDEIVDADGNTKIQVEESSDENKIRFDTAGSERMIIDAAGKVGIGISSPTTKLEIEVADSEDIGGLLIDFNETGAYRAFEIDSESGYANTIRGKFPLNLVGDLSSGYGLRVERNIDEAGALPLVNFIDDHTANTETTLRVQQDGTGDILNLFDGATEVFTVLDGGNVGIGVADPDQKLEVGGAIHISGETSTPSAPSDGDGGIMYVKTDGKLYFRSNEQSEVELTASPSNPGATLTMGTGAAENTLFAFDGNAQDFRIGINDTLDHFEIGAGLTMGTTTALRFTGTGDLVQIGSQTPSDGQVLYWDQGNSRVSWKTVAAGAAIWFLLGGSTAYDANQMSYVGFAYASAINDYTSPWPRYDAVGTITLG